MIFTLYRRDRGAGDDAWRATGETFNDAMPPVISVDGSSVALDLESHLERRRNEDGYDYKAEAA